VSSLLRVSWQKVGFIDTYYLCLHDSWILRIKWRVAVANQLILYFEGACIYRVSYFILTPNNVFGSLMPFSPIEFFWQSLLYCLCPLISFIFFEGKYHLPIVIYTYSKCQKLIRSFNTVTFSVSSRLNHI